MSTTKSRKARSSKSRGKRQQSWKGAVAHFDFRRTAPKALGAGVSVAAVASLALALTFRGAWERSSTSLPSASVIADAPQHPHEITQYNSPLESKERITIDFSGALKSDSEKGVSPTSARIHLVRSGDSFWKIAQAYYDDANLWDELAAFNGYADPDSLQVGASVRVPPRTEILGEAARLR